MRTRPDGKPDAGASVVGINSTFDGFTAVAISFADEIAVLDDDGSCTYAELADRSRAIARLTLDHTTDRRPLAVVATKSSWTVAAMFAPLFSGHPTLLLDPDEPDDRWAGVSRRAEVGVVLQTPGSRSPAAGTFDVGVHSVDDLVIGPRDGPAGANPLAPSDAVWLIATSGSTGVPKIVSATEDQTVRAWRRQTAFGRAERITPGDVQLVLPPLAFLAARGPLFMSLSNGAAARVVDAARNPPSRLVELLEAERVRTLSSSPWHLRTLVEAGAAAGRQLGAIEKISLSGGPMTTDDVEATWRVFPNARVRIVFGSSELPHIAEMVFAPGDRLEVGASVRYDVFEEVVVRVLDDAGGPAAPGEIGRLVVHGPEMTSGYIADHALTAETLSIDGDGVAWFHQGDLGRFHADGRLEIHGRDDARVKVNGLAVDLIVVTRAVLALPGVADAEVASVADGEHTHLVAWVVAEGATDLSVRTLRRELATTLPEYMVPRVFRALSAIPRTPRGKVDRMALRAAAADEVPLGIVDEAPASEVERRVAELVATVLDRDQVGRHGGFFELGGDSLAALELLASLTAAFDVADDVRPLLEEVVLGDGSVEELAAVLGDTAAALAGREGTGLRADGLTVVRLGHLMPTPDDGVPTVVVLPGGGLGGLLEMRGLARRLRRWPVLGFDPPGSHSRHRPDPTTEHTATRIVDALRELDPVGPFLVVGYSFGGLAAYDVATRLEQAGAPVLGLALLDTPRPGSIRHADPGTLATRLRRQASLARRRALRQALGVLRLSGDARSLAADGQARLLTRRFSPSRFGGPTVVIRSDARRNRHQPADLGWTELLDSPPTTVDARGTHKTILVPPGVDAMADAIGALGSPT